METILAAFALAAFLICVGAAVVGMALGYNVELMFHPPIFVRLKLTRTRPPEDRQVRGPDKAIPAPRQPAIPPEGQSVEESATPISSDTNDV